MIDEPSARVAPESDIDYRLLIPFLTHVTLLQTLILIVRITTSYRALELGLPVVWLGIIATGFAIIPVFTALQVGRWIDRGNDARAAWLGSALVFIACVGFWAWPQSAMHLLGFSVLLGFGHMFCMAGHQMLAVRSGGKRSREAALGYYMVAASNGQGLGPFVVGRPGGWGALPPTRLLFAISLAAAGTSVIVALLIRPAALKARRHDTGDVVPIGQLLTLSGFAAVMVSSVVTVTSLDLLVIYLPALGAERHIGSDHIGLLLTVRSLASLVSRVFYARLIFAIGRTPLTLTTLLGSAAAFLVLALPLSLPTMYGILICLGFAMGIASTLTLSGVMHLAPPEVCGTALTLRMTGNRVGQIVFPALAGVLAAATGVAGILLALGLGLAASGIAVAMTQPPSWREGFARRSVGEKTMPDPIQIRMGGYGPASTGFSRALKFIGDRLTAEFGDRVDVKYVWNIMELGYRAEDILWLVEHGLLTLGYQSSSYLTDRVPELGIADLPFLFARTRAARAAMDGALGDLLARKIEERVNYRVLGWFENGFRHISNRVREVRAPKDLAGLRI